MSTNEIFSFDDVGPDEQPGAEFDGKIYPWAILGPIENAKLRKYQEQIQDILTTEDTSIEDATEVARIQGLMLRTILPSMPQEVMNGLSDGKVEAALRFFDVWRMNGMADQAEEQMVPANRLSKTTKQIDVMNKEFREIGARQSRNSSGSTEAIKPAG